MSLPDVEGDQRAPFTLLDMPDDVLALVVSAGPTRPAEAASWAATCRRLRRVAQRAPFCLRMEDRGGGEEESPAAAAARLLATLRSLCISFPGTAGLDLSSLPLGNEAVELVRRRLPALAHLLLPGCKKLTAAAVRAAVRAPALRCLDAQRCFQLRADALTELLAAAARPHSKLATLALSHLDLSTWAPHAPAPTALRVLALHNCAKLTAPGLRAIVAACPNLEVLCLGGCGLTLVPDAPPAEEDPLVASLVAASGSCGMFSALLSSGHGLWLRRTAAELAAAAARLPRLAVLELTFCGPGLMLLIERTLEAAAAGGDCPAAASARRRLAIWDLGTACGVAAALRWRSASRATPLPPLPAPDVAAVLAAAARCSSAGRVTALHSAAEEGDPDRIASLLVLGAEVDARDRGGATPLFCAAEAGHAGAAAALLAAGAAATRRNAAGEAPLYIAALRGHGRVVEALLRHCAAAGIRWEDPRLYGDGWTPLHAAAVGGRPAIVAQLLAAAGGDAGALVNASNRYGQTCVHVAARKGTPALVQMLVDAGGAAALERADCDGRTAADVARRNGNSGAWRLLTGSMSARGRGALQRATTPTVERPRAAPAAAQGGARWVGRRLQQRKSGTQGG